MEEIPLVSEIRSNLIDMKKKIIFGILVFLYTAQLPAQDIIIRTQKDAGFFPVVSASGPTAIYVDKKDHWLMQKVAELLQQDIEMITGEKPRILDVMPASADQLIIIGSMDSSDIIRTLAAENKIHTITLKGQWEKFQFQTLDKPVKGIQRALIIAGSDKRGTAFGVLEMSKHMGVSPWYWWADVPAKKKKEVYIKKGLFIYGSPSVKYRGIFINDEAPAFSGWAKEKFGGLNHQVYEKVFELLLRLKANYLWPAMWGNAFNDDDSLNPLLAQKYGIVMGTSHHEPMLRAQQEWKRYGRGPWNYDSNEVELKAFWKKGIENMDGRESLITIGMRGDGDMPMTEGSNIALLERIVRDQRKIIAEVTGKPAANTPQLWALYKEVQAYYDKGMTVPDDVTLLLCDDNWGNIRRLPRLSENPRPGGYGIYYHFDYVGDPRNYKWLNTNSISRVWEQMNLAKQYGVDRIWIVNVGDLKPMELPIQFFLDYAWDTKKWDASNISLYTDYWSEQVFGSRFASEIAGLLSMYTKYNSRRKPELLSPTTYSLVNFREAENIETDYIKLANKAENIYGQLAKDYKDAFYQLVLYPIKATANLNRLYITAGRNRLYAKQGRASTNEIADSVVKYFKEDADLSNYYNREMSEGKWNHMMDQTHIGYTYWQQPEKNAMPAVEYVQLPDSAEMGLTIEGSDSWWPFNPGQPLLPEFNSYLKQSHYFEIFNRGNKPFPYSVDVSVPWLKVFCADNIIYRQERLWVKIDWYRAPVGVSKIPITITSADGIPIIIFAIVKNYGSQLKETDNIFVETDGYIAVEATHYTRKINKSPVFWEQVPEIGRTGSGMMIQPVTADSKRLGSGSPRLEFDMILSDSGKIQIQSYFSPTLDFNGKELQYAISIDGEMPSIVNLHPDHSIQSWELWVADNIIISTQPLFIKTPGRHCLKFWMVDPGIVLQKITASFREIKPSYLGPSETKVHTVRSIPENVRN